MARHPSRPTSLDYIAAPRPLRRTARRPAVSRRPGDRRRLRAAARPAGRWPSGSSAGAIRRRTCAAISAWSRPRAIARSSAWHNSPRVWACRSSRSSTPKAPIPGITSEEHAQSEAIATCLLRVYDGAGADRRHDHRRRRLGRRARARRSPITSSCSSTATYSVASPEALRGDTLGRLDQSGRSRGAVEVNGAGSAAFRHHREIVPEPLGGAHRDPASVVARGARGDRCGARAAIERSARRNAVGGALSKVSPDRRMAGRAAGRRRNELVKRRHAGDRCCFVSRARIGASRGRSLRLRAHRRPVRPRASSENVAHGPRSSDHAEATSRALEARRALAAARTAPAAGPRRRRAGDPRSPAPGPPQRSDHLREPRSAPATPP